MIRLVAAIASATVPSARRREDLRGRVASGAGHADPAIRRFGRRAIAAARPARPRRSVALPEARLAHGRRDRAGRAGGARRGSSSLWRRRRAIAAWLATRDRGIKLAMVGAVGAVLLLMVGTRRQGVRLHDARQRLLQRAATSSCPAARSSCGPTPGPTCWSTSWRASTTPSAATAATRSSSRRSRKSCSTGSSSGPDEDPAPRQGARATSARAATCRARPRRPGHGSRPRPGTARTSNRDSSALKDVACLTCHARTRPPVPARRHDLRPEGLPPDRRGQDQARTDGGAVRAGQAAAAQRGEALLQLLPPVHRRRAVRDAAIPRRASSRPAHASASAATRCATLLASFDPAKDPHGGTCGMCHNPHTDAKPARCAQVLRRRAVPRRLARGGVPHRRGPPEGAAALPDLPPPARGPGGRE